MLRSVVYASLFDYPLTLAQLESTLPGVRADAAAIESWCRDSAFLQSAIEQRDGLYFPAGRADLVQMRSRREAVSRELLDRDRRILALVTTMPFVRMVALSGSLAHLNAEPSADLDLFVITAPHRVWGVTVATLLVSKLLGWRTRLCMNYVISEHALRVEPQDLFSANQIIHLRPITGHALFDHFVKSNPFVRGCYPNFELGTKPSTPDSGLRTRDRGFKTVIEAILSLGPAQLVERISRVLYAWHLRRRSACWHSRDQVRLDAECLKLHTTSHRGETLARYETAVAAALQTDPRATLAS